MKRILISIVFFFLIVGIYSWRGQGVVLAQTACIQGDANGDGRVTLADFAVWRSIYLGQNPTPTSGITPTPVSAKAKLILHNWPGGGAISPQYVKDNLTWLETNREFLDGVAVIFNGSGEVMTNQPTTYETYMVALAPLKNLPATKLKTNFALVFNNKPADVFDDWTIARQNWKNLAKAVKDTGLAGIMFDNEEYFEFWGDWPEYSKYKEKTLNEYQLQTMLRGKQIMEVIVSQFPDIDVMFLHGPYISEPKSVGKVYALPDYNELKGPFFSGFMQGKGTTATLIDGGEIYNLRTVDQFNKAYEWQKNGMSSDETNSAFVPPQLRPIWKRDLSVAYGIYNKPEPSEVWTPAVYQSTLMNALNRADDYVWLYTDDESFINIGSPQMGAEWIQAARNAKNAAQ